MSVVIIDYGSGNLRSAEKSLMRVAARLPSPPVIQVSADPAALRDASHIVLPGVGAFRDCHKGLIAVPGMFDALERAARTDKTPMLGICVGMQLLASLGLEFGEHPGFDWIPGKVQPLDPGDPALKIPHMGWNALHDLASHPVLTGIAEGDHMYFVHSYVFQPANPAHIAARCSHGRPFVAAVARDNLFGVQFHPEKSQVAGLKLLENFLSWQN